MYKEEYLLYFVSNNNRMLPDRDDKFRLLNTIKALDCLESKLSCVVGTKMRKENKRAWVLEFRIERWVDGWLWLWHLKCMFFKTKNLKILEWYLLFANVQIEQWSCSQSSISIDLIFRLVSLLSRRELNGVFGLLTKTCLSFLFT